MKVLIFIPYVGSHYGGTSKATREFADTLSSLGANVDLITTDANGSDKLDVPLNKWIYQKSYRIRYFSCWHHHDFIVSLSLIYWLIKHIKDYDIVHTNTVFSPLVSLVHLLCQWRKIPYAITPHGMLEPWALSYKAWKKRIYYNLLEKPALKKASVIQVIANAEASNVKKLGFRNLVVVPNGIHHQEFENLPTSEIFYEQFPETRNKTLLLFLGRIDPKKGLDLLAPAFGKIHKKFPQTHLVVAGPDSTGFLAIVRRYFAQAGCLEAVTFTGMLTGKLKQAALVAADLYVAPSYSEGFSMSVLEGMASGLPCVITTGCNFPEAAQAQAAHIVDTNPDEIANALIDCLSNPAQAQAMGDRARKLIFRNYTWERAAEKLVKVYQAIVDKKVLPEYQDFIPAKSGKEI
ncbi:group 1 glycosyl transferase [Nostoc carneum NIES-2107]|nr:group 1 glycosyl transferase [Nostoc carneum NIES-2107]